MAGLGQTSAETLTFAGAPTFDGSHPKLIGELYSGATRPQIIILNLDNVAHTVNVSGVISGGTFRQIYGKAGCGSPKMYPTRPPGASARYRGADRLSLSEKCHEQVHGAPSDQTQLKVGSFH